MHRVHELISRATEKYRISDALKSVGKVISGNVAANLISAVTSILIVRWTIPREMGLWNAALLITTYSPAVQLGVFNGLNRELPYLIGAGDKDRALRMAQAAYAWSWYLTGITTLCGALASLWFWIEGERSLCFTSAAVTVLVACSWSTNYLTTTYRTNSEFGRLARNTVVVALAGAALVALVWRFHFNGLLLRAALVGVLGVAALYFRRPLPVKPKWGTTEFIHLAKVGIPIWLAGLLSLFFTSLDRLMLVKSTQVLGYFTIAIQVASFVRLVPTAFTIVLYPQMAHRYGQNHCAADLWRIARKGALGASVLGLVVGACGWLLLPSFVHLVLPKYGPGIRAAQWSGFLGFAMGLYLFDNIFIVIKRLDLYAINYLCGSVTFVVAWYLLTRLFHVPLAIASSQAMLSATFLTALTSALLSRRVCTAHDDEKKAKSQEKVIAAPPGRIDAN